MIAGAPKGESGRLALAGFFATAVAFGPARNGYGLSYPISGRSSSCPP